MTICVAVKWKFAVENSKLYSYDPNIHLLYARVCIQNLMNKIGNFLPTKPPYIKSKKTEPAVENTVKVICVSS